MVATQSEVQEILIVEDDENVVEIMQTMLRDAGFQTEAVSTGRTALKTIEATAPDLILLDLQLPDLHGLDVINQVRAQSFLPLIVISGLTDQSEKVAALEAGADDFLAKPFAPDELVARVRALLRRVDWTPEPQTRIIVRRLELDMPRRQAVIKGEKLHLTPIEYGLLATLMRKAGSVVTHNELLLAVWGDNYKGDYSVLRVNISRLRQKLEDNPRNPDYILTVAGQGYTMPTD
ncbi:MAG: response regulator transcription factor [Chloroflexota bacterium]